MQIDLGGTTALVTGGSSGIGEAISEALAECGAKVAIHYNTGEKSAMEMAARFGGGCEAFCADLSDPGAARDLFASAAGSLGRIDLLVNNAGIFTPAPPEVGHEDWMKT